MAWQPSDYPQVRAGKKASPQIPETIAQVGGHKPPTTADVCRVVFAAEQCGVLWPQNVVHSDVVNLAYDRDFLTEDRTYDVVLVHCIFDTSQPYLETARRNKHLGPQISPNHSDWEWARRLVSTKARLIVICEHLPFSLSGLTLGELSGYKTYKHDSQITIYVRVEP